jgi:hypothetical protein
MAIPGQSQERLFAASYPTFDRYTWTGPLPRLRTYYPACISQWVVPHQGLHVSVKLVDSVGMRHLGNKAA